MPVLRILDSSGDTVVEWSRSDEASVTRARQVFCQMHAERRLAFRVAAGSRTADSEPVTAFDPAIDEDIIMVRATAGG
jgi:hypothetical protein